ncbi:MAG: aminoglycoside phosphotransferase family protein [Verrucomicrobia bacterium]|nr:aminoglycoside phosphotransferase family protein [Verrucomicrobiota bacterium]MCF7707432.1 aminoglycoside phosphotransferase family protein [Verrucomicrobiota bacterium]
MAYYEESKIRDISRHFDIYGEILHAEPCKIGHINETYSATYSQGGAVIRYVHQKINQSVFKDPPAVMDNILRVTRHLRAKLTNSTFNDITRRTLTVIPAIDGNPYFQDDENDYWRTYIFLEGVQTFEAVQSPKQAFQAGKAFGEFQQMLSDLPGKRLNETIPDFHNSRKRFNTFAKAVQNDKCNRARYAKKEIDFALANEPLVDVLLDAHKKGKIPERITHNDTKFNNVMLDMESGRQMCVIDLDTVMPGLIHYDFGDMVRTTTSPTVEDEIDLSKVHMDMKMFEALARGYTEAANGFITKQEKALLAFAGKLITFTIGLRFLADYLNGDIYFRVHRPGHNLDRCRTQFKLVESIARQEDKMRKFIDSL